MASYKPDEVKAEIVVGTKKLGCPAANGDIPCRGCGGGWPGTKITHKAMLKYLKSPNKKPLGCGMLLEQVKEGWYEA